MTPTEYAELAAKTCNPERDDLIHHGLGLVCEYLEFRVARSDREQLEEIGDALWFLAGIARSLEVPFHHLCQPRGGRSHHHTADAAMESVLSSVKAFYAYGREIEPEGFLAAVAHLVDDLMYEADCLGYLHRPQGWAPEIAAANIAKLRRRYPEGFNSTAAIERADKAGAP